jgi:hypothetical protein
LGIECPGISAVIRFAAQPDIVGQFANGDVKLVARRITGLGYTTRIEDTLTRSRKAAPDYIRIC